MRWFRFITRSIRAKVVLLIFSWSALLLAGHILNGVLAAMNSGDADLITQVSLLGMLPQSISRSAVSLALNDHDRNPEAMKQLMEGYKKTLGDLKNAEIGKIEKPEIGKPELFLSKFIKHKIFASKIDESRIHQSIGELSTEWETQKRVFERVLSGDREVTTSEIEDATTELVDRSERLNDTIKEVIEEKNAKINRVNLTVLFGGIVLAIIAYFTLQQMILTPIERLRATTESFARGQKDAQALISSSDEIGKLARTFNSMIKNVAEREVLDQERLAEIAAKNEQLLNASKMKSQFLANMSHELRTPMNSIIGYSDVLLDELDGKLNPEQREDVQAVLRSAENLLKLINEILDLSKIEAGHMKVELGDVSLRSSVKEVLSAIEPLIVSKGLTFEMVAPDEDVVVKADRDRLRQIIMNLISNAVKFTDKGRILVRVSRDNLMGTVEVEDTGMGIPPDQIEAIFDEFHQVDGATTRKHGGTGLGLAIAKRFAGLMSGTIVVSSVVDKGSMFAVKLPLVPVKPRSEQDATPTLLIVEDDPDTISLYRRHIEKERINVITTSTVVEAISILQSVIDNTAVRRPVAAMLDVVLPDGTGHEVLKFIKSEPLLKMMKVAFVTIADDDGLAAAEGAEYHFVKPIGRAELIALAHRLVDPVERI